MPLYYKTCPNRTPKATDSTASPSLLVPGEHEADLLANNWLALVPAESADNLPANHCCRSCQLSSCNCQQHV